MRFIYLSIGKSRFRGVEADLRVHLPRLVRGFNLPVALIADDGAHSASEVIKGSLEFLLCPGFEILEVFSAVNFRKPVILPLRLVHKVGNRLELGFRVRLALREPFRGDSRKLGIKFVNVLRRRVADYFHAPEISPGKIPEFKIVAELRLF